MTEKKKKKKSIPNVCISIEIVRREKCIRSFDRSYVKKQTTKRERELSDSLKEKPQNKQTNNDIRFWYERMFFFVSFFSRVFD